MNNVHLHRGHDDSPLRDACALQRGMALLPDLHVTDSSEAMLSGRKPPFRLLVRAVHADGHRLNVRHAVSEGFVVSPLPPPPGEQCFYKDESLT